MEVAGIHYFDKDEAGNAILTAAKELKIKQSRDAMKVGTYQGFTMYGQMNFMQDRSQQTQKF